MPFVANTPESLMGRSDSKNPNATCRGITSNGRACRRAIAKEAAASLSPAGNSLLPHNKPRHHHRAPDPSDESLYCWQHKEQATHSARSSPGPPRATPATTPILEERASLDTLADRLGLLDVQEKGKGRSPGDHGQKRPKQKGQAVNGFQRPAKPPKTQKKLEFCFCFTMPIEEVPEPTRRRPQPRPVQQQQQQQQQQRQTPSAISAPGNMQVNGDLHTTSGPSPRQRLPSANGNNSPSKSSYRSRRSNASQTAQAKDVIPDSLDPSTASALMAELARPYVDSEEPGYIYMFWVTPSSEMAPPVDAARSLLAPLPPSQTDLRSTRRASDAVANFAGQSRATSRKTMVLKIGRAANVQRRMNQWQRQCGYDVEMLRYYPYFPGNSSSNSDSNVGLSGSSGTSGTVPHMTKHCHRVERLIHIELSGVGLKANMDTCKSCGRAHREWFEVDASRTGIRQVDEVIRRWIEWDKT